MTASTLEALISQPLYLQEEVKRTGGAGADKRADRGADEAASEDRGNVSTAEDIQLEREVDNLIGSLVSNLFEIVPEQGKDHQVVEATVVQIFTAATSADEVPASELALNILSKYGDSPLLLHRLVCLCTAHVSHLHARKCSDCQCDTIGGCTSMCIGACLSPAGLCCLRGTLLPSFTCSTVSSALNACRHGRYTKAPIAEARLTPLYLEAPAATPLT